MATLGSTTTGFTFTISGSFGCAAGGLYTVPSPGIFVDDINVYAGNNGSASTDRLCIWQDSAGRAGARLLHSHTFRMGSTRTWQTRPGSDLLVDAGHLSSDGYLPAGAKIWIGIYASTGILAYEGASSGTTDLGNTADGDFSYHDVAAGFGVLAAYIHYTALAAPTLTSASPNVAPVGNTVTLTGTNLLHTTGITVCGVTASTYTITDDSHITVTVPAGATGAGNIVVTTPAGSASIAFTAGQIYFGTGSGVASPVAIWYGDPSGSGVPHKVAGVWVSDGAGGVRRVW